jgi:hypothetical protein
LGASLWENELAITSADWNYSATYTGEETSGTIQRAIAYSVYMAVLSFMNDPQVQGHLRCSKL